MFREWLLQRTNVFGNEREDGLHPSQIARDPYCLRRHKLEIKYGSGVTDELQLLFNIGHMLHNFYRDVYFPEIYDKENRICFYLPSKTPHQQIKVVGSIDGKVDVDGKPYLVEIKSTGSEAWKMFRRPKATHVNQMMLYMYAEQLQHGYLIYINKDTGDIKEWIVDYDPELTESLFNLIVEIDDAERKDELPLAHKKCTPSSVMRSQCPFSERCFPNTTEDE